MYLRQALLVFSQQSFPPLPPSLQTECPEVFKQQADRNVLSGAKGPTASPWDEA